MVVSSATPRHSLATFGEVLGIFGVDLLEQILDDALFLVAGRRVDPAVAVLELDALMDEEGDVAAVVDDELGAEAVPMRERLFGAPPILFERLAFPGEDGDAGGGDSGSGVVLRGEDVAACPADVGAEGDHGLDENGGLDRHVERSGDANTGERLACGVLVADGHEAGHLLLGDVDLFAAECGQTDIGDLVFRCYVFGCCRIDHCCCHGWTALIFVDLLTSKDTILGSASLLKRLISGWQFIPLPNCGRNRSPASTGVLPQLLPRQLSCRR